MTTIVTAPDLAAIKSRQQQMWASGDYSFIGAILQIVAETLCEAVDLRAGSRVLDVATGSGNAALAAARRFAVAVGVDYVPALLERAEARAAAEGLPIEVRVGDAEALPADDASFDVVLSTFGVMFAPDQEQTARELLRVCRPGGKIGLANWTPESFIGTILRTIGRHVPPAPGLSSPALWGTEGRLRELFGDDVATLEMTPRAFTFRFRSPEHWLDYFRTYYGPTFKAFAALSPEAQSALEADLLDVLTRFNRADDGTFVAPSAYLEAVAVRR